MIKQFIEIYSSDIHDATIDNVSIEYFPSIDGLIMSVKMKINVINLGSKDEHFDKVEMNFIDISQFSFFDKNQNGCLIHQSKIQVSESEILFDFGYNKDWDTKNELVRSGSPFFIVCKDFSYRKIR